MSIRCVKPEDRDQLGYIMPVPVHSSFVHFTDGDYQAVCDFLIAINQRKSYINWNWARWEWMYVHPYTDRKNLNSIGLWKADGVVVGAAIYDMYFGEVFCGTLDEYRYLLPEIMEYAWQNLKDENGLGIAIRDDDEKMRDLLSQLGYQKAEQTEPILCCDLNEEIATQLPEGFIIREIHLPEEMTAYQTVIWKGFDHEGDDAELQKMRNNDAPLPPHIQQNLCLGVADNSGEYVAHCTCWYDKRTDYAYVEPVCTIPAQRGKGLGKAVVLEALSHCRALGAKKAFVLSDQEFYKKLGFGAYARYTFYWKQET